MRCNVNVSISSGMGLHFMFLFLIKLEAKIVDNDWVNLDFFDSQTQQHVDLKDLLVIIFFAILTFGALLIICELSQRQNLAYKECGDMVEQLDWYRFPTEIQRIYPTILAIMQQPIEIVCFGGTTCNRESFKKVSTLSCINFALMLASLNDIYICVLLYLF